MNGDLVLIIFSAANLDHGLICSFSAQRLDVDTIEENGLVVVVHGLGRRFHYHVLGVLCSIGKCFHALGEKFGLALNFMDLHR